MGTSQINKGDVDIAKDMPREVFLDE